VTAHWQSTFYIILPDITNKLVRMERTEAGWTLPYIRLETRLQLHTVEPITHLIQRELCIDAAVLRCVDATIDHEAGRVEAVFLLEALSPDPEFEGWVDMEVLEELNLVVPQHRLIIESALSVIEEVIAPWQRRGWYDRACSWIRTKTAASNRTLIGPIEQVRSWDLSCVLRATTDLGRTYFKVAGSWPLVANEAHVMEMLSRWFPAHIPEPLAIDEMRGWMLLADFGTPLRNIDLPLAEQLTLWETAIRAFARMQRATPPRDLLSIGCSDRRLNILLRQLDTLVNDDDALTGLSTEAVEAIRANVPHLRNLGRQLNGYMIPATLVHGDFHSGNICLRNQAILFFDWTDASLAHPFFDLVTFLDEAQARFDESAVLRLRDAYLMEWTAHEPLDRLQGAFEAATKLGALFQAVSYYSIFTAIGVEAKQEMDGAIAYWLLKTLP
jgi:aminoglycoside/choline kinase family phosphotransferase